MKPEHTLVQYHGGGYSGCYWEWNFAFIDHEGKFYDVFSSGRDGCDTAEKLEKLLTDEQDHVYFYDTQSESDLAEFATDCNNQHISGVLQWFEDNCNDCEFYAICGDCGEKIFDCDGMYLESEEIICSDCYCCGLCDVCNEYVGQDQIQRNPLNEEEAICGWCIDYAESAAIAERATDLRFQAMTTGTPDIMSDFEAMAKAEIKTQYLDAETRRFEILLNG